MTYNYSGATGYTSASQSAGLVSGCSYTFETDWDVTLGAQKGLGGKAEAGTWNTTYYWEVEYTPSGEGDTPGDITLGLLVRDYDSTVASVSGLGNMGPPGIVSDALAFPGGGGGWSALATVAPTNNSATGVEYDVAATAPAGPAEDTATTSGAWGPTASNTATEYDSWTESGGDYYITCFVRLTTNDSSGWNQSPFTGYCYCSDLLHEQVTVNSIANVPFTPWQ
jgi:hypothetical protein